MAKILFIGPIADCTGNKSTAVRIKSFFNDCLLKGLDDFINSDDLNKFVKKNRISCIICLHAFKSSRLFNNGCSVPYAVIFGGTDLNVFSKNDDHKLLMTKTLWEAKAIVSFSKTLESLAANIWPTIIPKKSFIIPQGVSCAIPSTDFIPEKYSFTLRHNVFTLIAGLRKEKDPLYLLSAFQEWQNVSGNNDIMLIIGSKLDRDYSNMFLKEVERYPSVKYLGQLPQSEVFLILKHSFALVNSSRNEGMSNVILEAMFLGVPILARDIEGNKALIEDGYNGLLFDSPQEFVTKATCLMQNFQLRNEIKSNGQQYVAQNHDPEVEKDNYQQLVNYLLGS